MVRMAEHFDVVILGGGPGGYAAALYGAAAGLSIGLVEEQRVGGVCLHRGCVPAKELLQTAEVLRTVTSAGEFGVEAGAPTVDLAVSQTRKQQVVDRLTRGLESLLKGRKVTVVPGTGTVASEDGNPAIRVADGTTITGDALVVATGSSPRGLPGLGFDGQRILSSDHVLELTDVPARIAIIGAGAIGCEFASLFTDLGAEVTLLEALPRLLPGGDTDASQSLGRAFKKRGITAHAGARVTSIEGTRELTIGFEVDGKAQEVVVDRVVLSIGRAPRSAGIGLEELGVQIDDRGHIAVDGEMRTNMPGVYAIGDVVATPALAHVGFAEAMSK
jgi:dihydrolipoamide dehydrogenase